MTAHNTPSMTQTSSCVPTTKYPMFTGTGKGSPPGHQVVVSPVQRQSPSELHGQGVCKVSRRRGDDEYAVHLNMNIKTKRRTEGLPVGDRRQGILRTGNIPDTQQTMRSRTHGQQSDGHQMAVTLYRMQPSVESCETSYEGLQMATPSLQVQPSVKSRTPSYGEAKRHHKDVVYEECLNVNVDPMARGAGMTSAANNTEGRGNAPGSQQMTHSRTRKQPNGHQTAVSPSQSQSSMGSSAPICEEPRGRPGDTRYGGYPNRDNEYKRRLTKSSVSKNKRSTVLYSPKTTPKAPDKGDQCIDNKLRTEAHYAPWPRERDHIENMTCGEKKS
jgi:hypothetical protein